MGRLQAVGWYGLEGLEGKKVRLLLRKLSVCLFDGAMRVRFAQDAMGGEWSFGDGSNSRLG